nr:unnamed protein product [Digitaria exilis]
MKTFILTMILVVSLATMFTSGAACDKTLQSAPDAAAVTTYALIATKKASEKYSDTMNKINMMLGAKDLPSEEREAISHCREKYREASSQMASGADHLSSCDFRHTRQEFMDALTAVRSCLDRLHDSFQSLPLYVLVEADFAVTGVASDLEALTNSGW